ncbi:MAG: hypothetical protein D6B26_02800 [Spirochaetaceae bacterium]|nr:MAG: hypothetical protein D6B26_02800 [Spirochaetaceae bacterium]
MSTMVSIPVVFVAGLLGAGKSTTVASLLDSRKSGTVGVVVQDLAEADIDYRQLQGGETMPTSPQIWIEPAHSSINAAIKALIDRADFDAIIIECSGAVPLSSALQDSRLDELYGLHYAGSITIIDANYISTCENSCAVPAILQDAFIHTDLILLNKIDRVPVMRRSGVQANIRKLIGNHHIPMRATRFGRVSLNELLQSLPSTTRCTPSSVSPQEGPALQHGVFFSRQPFRSADFYNWLQNLTDNPPKGLLRAKGYFHIDSLPQYIMAFDVVHKHIEIGIDGMWWSAIPEGQIPDDPEVKAAINQHPEYGDRIQELVFIGDDLDIDAILQELNGLLSTKYTQPKTDDPMHIALRKQLAQIKSRMRKRR